MGTFSLAANIDSAVAGPLGRGWNLAGGPSHYTIKIDNDGLPPPNGGNLSWGFSSGTLIATGYTGITPNTPPAGFNPSTNLKVKAVSLTLPTGLETFLYDTTAAFDYHFGSQFPNTFFNVLHSLTNYKSYFELTSSGLITARSIYSSFATNADINAIWHGVSGIILITGNFDIISWAWSFANGIDFTVPTVTPAQTGKLFSNSATGISFNISSGYPGTGPRAGGSAAAGNILNIFDSVTNPLGTGPDLKGSFGAHSGSGIDTIVFSWFATATSNGIGINGSDSSLAVGTLNYIEVDNTDFDEWTSIFISFFLPNTLLARLPIGINITVSLKSSAFPAIPVLGGGTGTQFSGSVILGLIRILGTEASGIYKIVSNKRSDTVYINNPTNDDTAEFAIPYPHIKTGYIGG